MTSEFRPRPSWAGLLVVITGLFLTSRVLVAFAFWLAQTALAVWSGWHGLAVLYVSALSNPSNPLYSWPPLVGDPETIRMAMAAIGIGLALVLTYLWPASGRLSSQILVRVAGLELIREFAIAPGIAAALEGEGSISPAASLIAGLATLWIVGSHLLRAFGQPYETERRLTRLELGACLAVGIAVVGAFEWLAGYVAGTLACALVILTLLARFVLRPPRGYERVRDSTMSRAMIVAPVCGMVLAGLTVAVFGSPLFGLPLRALTYRDGLLQMRPIDDLLAEQLRLPEQLDQRHEEGIRWSRDRDSGTDAGSANTPESKPAARD